MNWALFQNSLLVSGLATLLATAAGFGFALGLATLGPRLRGAGLALAAVALAMPPFLVTNCWMDLLGQNGAWRAWLPVNIYTLPFAALVLAGLLWPIPMAAALAAWPRLQPAHVEAEPLLRGPALLRHLLLPVARPALTLAALLVFVLALANFAVPALLQVKVFAAEIWLRFSTNLDYAGALAASLPLVLAPLAFWIVARGREFAWPRWQGALPASLLRERLGRPLTTGSRLAVAALVLISVLLPLGNLLLSAQTWRQLGPAWAASGPAVTTSFALAAVAATGATLLGLVFSRRRGGSALWLPFFFPGALLGIGLIWLLNRDGLVAIYQSAAVVLLALTVRYSGPGWQAARLARQTLDPDLVDAARLEGASRAQTFALAVWPQIRTPLAAGWYGVYLLCLWDVETLVLIIPPGMETVALRIFNLLHYGHNPQVNALCLALLGLALLPLVAWVLIGRLQARGGMPGAAWTTAALAVVLLGTAGCSRPASTGTTISSRLFSHVEILGSRGRGPGQFNKPRSVTVDREDNLYVVDMTGRVQKFAPDGSYLLGWQLPETDLGKPKGMGIDAAGRVIVIEPHYSRVNHFDRDGRLALQWGRHGTNCGQFGLPRAITTNSLGELWVCEYTASERVQRFSPEGARLLACFGAFGEAPGQFNRPEGLAVDAKDRLVVADSCNHRIQVFEPDGRWLRAYGHAGAGPGELSYPYDVRVDPEGHHLVCEFGNSRIQVFDAQGRSEEVLGGPGAAPGQFSNPWSIALDSRGNLYVADAGNHRVQKLIRRTPAPRAATAAAGFGPPAASAAGQPPPPAGS